MKTYKVPHETLQATINFLAKCPYADVFQLLAALQSVEEIKEEKVEALKD